MYYQILRADHYLLVSALIKDRILDLDEHLESEDQSDEMELGNPRDNLPSHRHHYLGLAQRQCTVSELERLHQNDIAFKFFRRKLTEHLNEFFGAHSITLPNGKAIYIAPYDQVSYYFLKSILFLK